MNEKTEKKLLGEFIKILDDPVKAEKRFIKYTKISMFACVLIVFFLLSNNIDLIESKFIYIFLAFLSGFAFGISIWFLQASTQTGILVNHISKESMIRRINELAT